MTSIDKFIGTEFRSRYVNPTWIEGMKKEGYAGAGAMRAFVEYLWGWDATAPEVIDDAKWQETFDVYVEDKHKLGMDDFFEKKSPFAYQDMTARMVETVRKGYWKADAATHKTAARGVHRQREPARRRLRRAHVRQPAAAEVRPRRGPQGRHPGAGARRIPARRWSGRPGTPIESGGQELSSFARSERRADGGQPVEGAGHEPLGAPARGLPDGATGNRSPPAARTRESDTSSGAYLPLITGGPVVALLLVWRWRRSRRA